MKDRIAYIIRMYRVGEYSLRNCITLLDAVGVTEPQAIALLIP